MPITLSGRSLIYVFVLVLIAAIVALVVMFGMNFIYWLIGHRKYVPWAKALRFKRDDMKKTSEQVEEILGGDNGKGKKKSGNKSK